MNSIIQKIFFSLILFFSSLCTQAQDTIRILKEDEFLSIVRTNHPVAKQGGLLIDMARAQLQTIRGEFDPMLYYSNEQKTFDGKNYFNLTNAELAIPTWFGVEVYGGIENNFGDFVNTQTTAGRSSYAGVSVPLLKDLILDKRRAALKQGQLFMQQSQWERRNVINDLLLDAYVAYWDWAKNYQVLLVLENTIRINQFRYELVKISFQQGDRAAVDTTEALAQLQAFQQMREEAFLKFRKSSLELSTFLWLQNNQPAYISERVIPDTLWAKQNFNTYNVNKLSEWLTQTTSNHPKLQMIDFKLQALEVERRLKFQSLLPKADMKYNFLQRGYNVLGGSNYNFFENNYKFGFNVAIPIPNRSGFGQYRAAKIKIQSTSLERGLTQFELENKVRYYYNEVLNLQTQIRIYEDAYLNYVRLFDAEQLKFSLGETTLFFLNTRENKALEALQKLLELKVKFYQSFANLNWASGQLQ
ncbi:MAG: TolC family protein [Chitinophagaceae bacterium]|nr:TolC family protein [Chitinophagaceae bacterium]